MPNLETHCKISLVRTKTNDFRELHQWMDEGTKYLKYNHRLERHFFMQEYKDYIETEWSNKAVPEWLFHIALDNLETANKFAIDIYNTNYGKIITKFKNITFFSIHDPSNFHHNFTFQTIKFILFFV